MGNEDQIWASGRVLTKHQRERKRLRDRQSKAKRREDNATEVKALYDVIDQLTQRIETLEGQQGSTELLDTRFQISPEPSFLTVIGSGQSSVLPALPQDYDGTILRGSETISVDNVIAYRPVCTVPSVSREVLQEDTFSHLNRKSSSLLLAEQHYDFGGMNNDVANDMPQQMLLWELDEIDLTVQQGDITNDAQTLFSYIMFKASSMHPSLVCADDLFNQDALLRGVLNGWGDVSAKYNYFCPLWGILRLLDKRLFCLSGITTRLCTLRTIHLLLLCLISGSGKDINECFRSLPEWYKPRPAQTDTVHAAAVDVLPWPGLREHAIYNKGLTRNNHFWTRVIYDFRFLWPHSVHQTFHHDVDVGLYRLSGEFQNRMFDLRCWQMDLSFFESFPETYTDLVPALAIPRSLSFDKDDTSLPQNRGFLTYSSQHMLPLPLR